MEKDKQVPENSNNIKGVVNAKPDRCSNEPVLTNGCENGALSAHVNFQRQNEMINGQVGRVAGLQCNGNNVTDGLEDHVLNMQAQENESCERKNRKRKIDVKDLKVTMNGLDVRLNGAGYSRTVCNVYKHENDLIFGRTRGGVVNNQETVVTETHTSNGINDTSPQVRENGLIDDNARISREICLNGRELQGLTAPLAIPESFSDDESVHEEDIQAPQACNVPVGLPEDNLLAFSDTSEEHLPQVIDTPHTNESENSAEDEVLDESVSSDSLNCDDFDLEIKACDDIQNGAQNEAVIDSDLERLIENVDLQGNQEEHVQEVEDNLVEVEETEVDSNDDVGDFIEADLPPNVERLAFFSRDSTSDEDEGCGDEVLPNNDEDIVSDNETIDPTDGGYMSPSRHNEQKVLNSEKSSSGTCNVLSAASSSIRGEVANIYPCNISCDKSNDENDEYNLSSDCRCSGRSVQAECASCNLHNLVENSSRSGHRDINTLSGNNLCACCDRPMVVDNEHHQELGVNVCDKCFKELNAEQCRWFDNGAKHRTWPGSRSTSSSNYLNRNCGNLLMPFNNNSDKVSNNSFTCARFSSSDSDPYDRIYVSDSSEMISPDAETGTESVFQSSSLTSSGGTVVQYRQVIIKKHQSCL